MARGPRTSLQLSEERSVTLDSNGEGWIRAVGPQQYGEEWHITNIQTRCVNSVDESRLFIFRNGTSQMVEGTYSGNLDNSNTTLELRAGETLWFKYERGTEGAFGTVTISGDRFLAGRRGY